MSKYILYFGILTILLSSVFTMGYLKGKDSIHLEIYQKQIVDLKSQIKSQEVIRAIDLKTLESYHQEVYNVQTKYSLLKEELSNAKAHINNTNNITLEWLRYVSNGTMSMSEISESSTRINEESSPIEATIIAKDIIDRFEICTENSIQLNNLIYWIESQISTFNMNANHDAK